MKKVLIGRKVVNFLPNQLVKTAHLANHMHDKMFGENLKLEINSHLELIRQSTSI